MAKPPNIIRPVELKISIPEDLRGWLEMHLWSDSEGRVPHGAYTRLIQRLLNDYRAQIDRAAVPTEGASCAEVSENDSES